MPEEFDAVRNHKVEVRDQFMMTAVNHGSQKYSFATPLPVIHYILGGVNFYECRPIGVKAYDVSETKAMNDFKKAVAFIYNELANKKDEDLPQDGIEYRDIIMGLITVEDTVGKTI